MKTKMIKCAALAATILAGVGAYGESTSNAVVYCTATIVDNGGNDFVSVTLPPTEGCYDDQGNPVTIWNVGNVPRGGVADSWHEKGGPGHFTARNTGSVGAYLYVMTCGNVNYQQIRDNGRGIVSVMPYVMPEYPNVRDYLGLEGSGLCAPCISPKEMRDLNHWSAYHLALTTDTMAKVPTWRSLDHRWDGAAWRSAGGTIGNEVAGYMGYVDAGDYLTFDLKFWASNQPPGPERQPVLFTFCVEASTFPLWDHGRAVE